MSSPDIGSDRVTSDAADDSGMADAGPCTGGTDCAGGFCNLITGQCVATQCLDGAKNGSETDVDCGGSCPKCARDQACSIDGDCKTGSCVRFFCALVSGPPNWLPGPSLNTGRGLGSVGVEPLPGRQMLMIAIGGRQDAGDSDVSTTYETLRTTDSPLVWTTSNIPLPSGLPGYGEPAATDSLGQLRIFSASGVWTFGGGLWPMVASLPTPRDRAGAAAAPGGGVVYVVGGVLPSTGAATGVIESYDAQTDAWRTNLTPMPTPRRAIGAIAAGMGGDGRIYVVGGATAAQSAVGKVEAYSPSTDTWATLSEIPDPASDLSVVGGPDGRIYAIAGYSPANGMLATVNAYSAVTDRWSSVAPIDSGRIGIGVAVDPNGHIWAVGGTTNPELPGFTTVLIYGPSVSVTPTMAVAGAMASVSGRNFAANATVSIYFGSTAAAALATGTTNAAGTLTAPVSFRVPNLPAGEQALIVMDDRSQYPITLDFRVQ